MCVIVVSVFQENKKIYKTMTILSIEEISNLIKKKSVEEDKKQETNPSITDKHIDKGAMGKID